MNEAETRAEHIDPALEAAGWGVVEGCKVLRECAITPGRIEGHGRRGKSHQADYVLVHRNRKLAVVEAKAWDRPLTEGVGQAAGQTGRDWARFRGVPEVSVPTGCRMTACEIAAAGAHYSCTRVCTRRRSPMATEMTYTQARAGFARLLARVGEDHEVVVVRRRGQASVALIAADELSSLMETAHLLRSPANARRLLAALRRALGRKGSVVARRVGRSTSADLHAAVFLKSPEPKSLLELQVGLKAHAKRSAARR